MLGVVRRRVSSGGSVSLLRQSFQASRAVGSTSRVSSIIEKEMLLQLRGIGHVRDFSHLHLPGGMVSLGPMRSNKCIKLVGGGLQNRPPQKLECSEISNTLHRDSEFP